MVGRVTIVVRVVVSVMLTRLQSTGDLYALKGTGLDRPHLRCINW